MNSYEKAGISRRSALAALGVFLVDAACSPEKLFGPRVKVPRAFFGKMVPGYIVHADGTTSEPVNNPIGTLRIWNNGASLEWVYRNNWEGFDRMLRLGERLGADLLYVLAGEATTPLPPLAEWKAFVTEAVNRAAGRVQFWELWNEPVYSRATPEEMRVYAAEAYSIIKSRHASAVVLSPSLNELLTGYGRAFAEEFLAVTPIADKLAFHSYDPHERLPEVLGLLRNLTDLPLWNTETVGLEQLELQARAGVERVVLNGQIEADYDSSTPAGALYRQTYNRMTA